MSEGDLNVVGTTPKQSSKTNWKLLGAGIGVILLALGIAAGIFLLRQSQDVRERADASCPAAEACPVPNEPTLLRNCTPPEADNSPQESTCNLAGRVELCGGRQYCCPSAGASWTTNLALCPQETPTPLATPTQSAQPTATSTTVSSPTATAGSQKTATPTSTSINATPTSTSTAVSGSTQTPQTATPFPVPDTGTSWPSILGVGLGVLVVVFSLSLVL